jgi:uncharacterized membrane protein YgaE (UPF0421/DUF939 family)
MKTYRQFLEATSDDIKSAQAEENPVFKFKSSISELVNLLLDQLEEKDQDADQLVNKINRFKVELDEFSDDASNIIENKRTYLQYLKHLEDLSSILEDFENPPTNIDPLLEELKTQLSQFHEFIQTEIEL